MATTDKCEKKVGVFGFLALPFGCSVGFPFFLVILLCPIPTQNFTLDSSKSLFLKTPDRQLKSESTHFNSFSIISRLAHGALALVVSMLPWNRYYASQQSRDFPAPGHDSELFTATSRAQGTVYSTWHFSLLF